MRILKTEYNKIKYEERIKIPFFYRINDYNNESDFSELVKEEEIKFQRNAQIYIGKHFKNNGSNIYNCDTYENTVLEYNSKTIKSIVRSIDSIYSMYLGYYDKKSSKENYILFLEELILFYLKIIIDLKNKLDSNYFDNYNNFKNYKYLYIRFICLLKCPDIGKFTISSNMRSIDIIKESYFKDSINDLKKEINNIYQEIEKLNSFYKIIKATKEFYSFNFLSDYGDTKKIFKNSKVASEDDSNEYDEELIDCYYYIFEDKRTLKSLFNEAFKNLKTKKLIQKLL